MVAFFTAGTLAIALPGFKSPMPVLYLLIFIAGANTAQFYPLAMRSTGLGWASGIGRNGAIVGPLLGGALMAIELPLQLNFMAFAIPGAIAALAMTVFALNERRTRVVLPTAQAL